MFFTQDKTDDEGYPVRDRIVVLPGHLRAVSVFAGLVEAEGIRRGANHVRQLTILGDGAAWIWTIATEKFPEATQIVDLYHAREHLHELTRVLEFMLGDQREQWLAARLDDLDHGDIDGICAAARIYPLLGSKKDDLDKALAYFENNAPRMRYQWFRSAACSSAPAWSRRDARPSSASASNCRHEMDRGRRDAIIALRCREASSQSEQIWQRPRS